MKNLPIHLALPHAGMLLLASLLLIACGDSTEQATPDRGASTDNTASMDAGEGHGTATDLGTVTVGGREFGIVMLGELQPGKEGAFEVHPKGDAAAELDTLNVYLWVESQDGTQLSAPAKGGREGTGLHFHVTPRAGEQVPHRAVLRLRAEGLDERGSLPLDGHGHEHAEGAHHGVPAEFSGGGRTGHLELKLHDDKGDLELWLSEDAAGSRPFDLPLDATVQVEFIDLEDRTVTLRPRDADRNADEDGNPNVRDGQTNYFVFPGDTGADAAWLQGREFQSIVVLRFLRDGQEFRSEEFVLSPHTH